MWTVVSLYWSQCFVTLSFGVWLLQQCFDKAEDHVDDAQLKERKMTRDEWVHGSLLIINELLRCSNVEGEVS